MTLDIILYIIGALLMIIGFMGCILPVMPGIPLSYIGLLALHFTSQVSFSTTFLIVWLIIVIIVQILDYYIPIWGTKKFRGGKGGVWGSTIGLIIGVFLSPFGLIIMPFIGALIGELIMKKDFSSALKSAFGSFVGFFVGTLLKFIIALILAYYFFKELFIVLF